MLACLVLLVLTNQLVNAQQPARWVETDQTTYAYGEDVVVSFANTGTLRAPDWMGLYRASTDNFRFSEAFIWQSLCDLDSCTPTASGYRGELIFGYGDPDADSYREFLPLPPGEYVAVMMRNQRQPYNVLTESAPFTILAAEVEEEVDPTASPTAPVFALSAEFVSVWTDKSIYNEGEDISASFFNTGAQVEDWIAIYDSSVDVDNLSGTILWLNTCGSQTCPETEGRGTITFGYDDPDESWREHSFPLPPGDYIVVLARSQGNGSSTTLAYSPRFQVVL